MQTETSIHTKNRKVQRRTSCNHAECKKDSRENLLSFLR
jgi:hypothetical protein